MSLKNSRPITGNNRGRVYECRKCCHNPYQGERSKVMQHFYRKHVALDEVPFYCSICKFVTMSKTELENHVNEKVYPSHKATVQAMNRNGELVNENASLLQNLKHYIITERDIVRLSKEVSESIFTSRTRKTSQTGEIVKKAMEEAGIDTESNTTENILPQMLGDANLSPFSLNENPLSNATPKRFRPPAFAPRKDTRSPSPSCSEKSVCQKCEIRKAESVIIKNDVKVMGAAMAEMVKEMREMKEMINELKSEKENRNNNNNSSNNNSSNNNNSNNNNNNTRYHQKHQYNPYYKTQKCYSNFTQRDRYYVNKPRQNTHIRF